MGPGLKRILSCGICLGLALAGVRCANNAPDASPGTVAPAPSPSSSVDASQVRNGKWGGQHLGLDVTSTGATADFDCAKGEVDQPLLLDGNGDFDVPGTVTSTAGPIDESHPRAPMPATYQGHVDGDRMTLTVTYTQEDGTPVSGDYTLTYGSSGVHTVLCALEG